MNTPCSFDEIFRDKLFRIPDYQRGYAWGKDQLSAFWEDLINLPKDRSHYTGVLTLKEVASHETPEDSSEFWLIDDHSYNLYHVVDGQQRLTTFIVFLQAFVETIERLPENEGKTASEIYVTDTLSIEAIRNKYLFRMKPQGDQFRTYMFGYTADNPSYDYMRYRILGETGAGTVAETFYTLNLANAKTFFSKQLSAWHDETGMDGLRRLYRVLTKRFVVNEYVIHDEFDVFVAFETMNNRGKKLSDLELLKNRLIYLTTLYTEEELDPAGRRDLRDAINDAWKEVYYQLGRNKYSPLHDDEFLQAHWIMYFKYSQKTGKDYIRFLLDEQFTPQRVHKKVLCDVELEYPHELGDDDPALSDEDLEPTDAEEMDTSKESADLKPTEIKDYVLSLKESAGHWFTTFNPDNVDTVAPDVRTWLKRLGRIRIAYFRPLVMSLLKNVSDSDDQLAMLENIERFIFIAFRITRTQANYRRSEFYRCARLLDRGEISTEEIITRLKKRIEWAFDDDGHFRAQQFDVLLERKFANGTGFYGWKHLSYFLYEYEHALLQDSHQTKLDWTDLLKTKRDTISIEHIYPQTPTDEWENAFEDCDEKEKRAHGCSLGNLLLLSSAINSSLQNDSFENKKSPKYRKDGSKARNGYGDGSHSELEVARESDWGPEQIQERGLNLLRFMEKRWDIQFRSEKRMLATLYPQLNSSESASD